MRPIEWFVASVPLALVLVLAFAMSAHAAPRAQDGAECYLFADLALNAAAHAKHHVPRETFDAIVPDIYEFNTGDAREIARRVIDAAWRAAAAGADPGDFAMLLNRVCRARRGDMDSILGTSL